MHLFGLEQESVVNVLCIAINNLVQTLQQSQLAVTVSFSSTVLPECA